MKILKKIIKKLINLSGYEIVKSHPFWFDINKDFNQIYEKCRKYTMTGKIKMFSLYSAIKFIVQNGIPGSFVECGVWKGGSAMVMALTLKNLGITDREIWLYDTFEGAPEPTEKDITILKKESAIKIWKKVKNKQLKWMFASLEEVRDNLLKTGYPFEKIKFIKGKVEETLPRDSPENIALLRLDTDFYESTKCELLYLFPKLTKYGVLIIDDYGFWEGAKKAVDEYFEEKNIKMLLIPIESGVIGIKI